MRYGDDWLCFAKNRDKLEYIRQKASAFLQHELALSLNPKVDHFQPTYKGISYLGVDIWPTGKRLQPKIRRRVRQRFNSRNSASYRALILAHENKERLKEFDWSLLDRLE